MKKIRHIEKRVFFALLPRLIGNGRKSCPTSLYKHIRHLKCPLFASLRCPIFEPTRESPALPRSSPKSVIHSKSKRIPITKPGGGVSAVIYNSDYPDNFFVGPDSHASWKSQR
jgi:hypothetical protein